MKKITGIVDCIQCPIVKDCKVFKNAPPKVRFLLKTGIGVSGILKDCPLEDDMDRWIPIGDIQLSDKQPYWTYCENSKQVDLRYWKQSEDGWVDSMGRTIIGITTYNETEHEIKCYDLKVTHVIPYLIPSPPKPEKP
jgi:hypothetical protein